MDKKIKYDDKVYTTTGISDLILFAIYLISKKKENCTFERLVAECFTQFPKVFAFKRYPEWPDALKLDRQLRTLREKGLIVGNVRGYFSLTEFGKLKAAEVEGSLKKQPRKNKKTPPVRSGDDRLIIYIKNSPVFERFVKKPDHLLITEAEFRNLMRCTLETPLRVVKQNFEYYKKLAQTYKEEKLLDFLLTCGNQFFKKRGKNV